MHGQHVDAIACRQVEVAHGAVAEARIATDDGFDERHVVAADGFEGIAAVEGQMAAAAQFDHIPDLTVDDQQIPGLQREIMLRTAEQRGAAIDLEHLQAAAPVEVGLADALADHRRALRHPQFGHEGAVQARAQQLGKGIALGQQALAQRQHVDHADHRKNQRRTGDLEHAERLEPGLARDAIDQDVGRSTDHGQRAAENGRVGQRNQQLGRRGAGAPGQRNGHGRENRHHRGIVEKGGNDQRGDGQAGQHPRGTGAHQIAQPVAQRIDTAGSLQRRGNHEHAGDGHRRRVRQHPQHFGRRQQLRGNQHCHRNRHDDIRTPALAHEGHQHPHQHGADEIKLQRFREHGFP